MNTTKLSLVAFLALGLGAAGCGSEDGGAKSGDTDASAGGASGGKSGSGGTTGGRSGSGGSAAGGKATGGEGGSKPDGGGPIAISGFAREWDQDDPFDTPPLAGVEVCLRDQHEVGCVTTGADGSWKLTGVPPSSEVLVSMTKAGRVPLLRVIKTVTDDIAIQPFEGTVPPMSVFGDTLPNVPVDTKKGGLLFFITTPGTRFQGGFDWMRGFSVTATPKSGDGPLYLDRDEVLVPKATASQGGFGDFVNMADGEYTLKFKVPDGSTCSGWGAVGLPDAYGYPGADSLTIRVPVVAGFFTGPVGIFCSGPPPGDGGAGAEAGIDAGAADGSTDASSERD